MEFLIIFREIGNRKTKVSFRSKHSVNVAKLASDFGGGGHVRAAGASINETIDTAIGNVISGVREYFEDNAVCVSVADSLA